MYERPIVLVRYNEDGEVIQKAPSIAMIKPESDRSEHRRYKSDCKQKYDFLFKMVLTGDANAGKSSILKKFVHKDSVSSRSSEPVPTVGVEFTSKLV